MADEGGRCVYGRMFRCNAALSFRREQAKISMDVQEKEMELLSNSIAAYAHITGESKVTACVPCP